MTGCPLTFREHPSSEAKERSRGGMKNGADRWNLHLLTQSGAADGEAFRVNPLPESRPVV